MRPCVRLILVPEALLRAIVCHERPSFPYNSFFLLHLCNQVSLGRDPVTLGTAHRRLDQYKLIWRFFLRDDPEMPAPDYVPLVGCIGIQSKSALEEISSVSSLWEVCWGLLKGADQSKNWMGFLDPEALNSCLSKDPRWRLQGCAVATV